MFENVEVISFTVPGTVDLESIDLAAYVGENFNVLELNVDSRCYGFIKSKLSEEVEVWWLQTSGPNNPGINDIGGEGKNFTKIELLRKVLEKRRGCILLVNASVSDELKEICDRYEISCQGIILNT